MATIASIVKARKGSAGSGNAWRVKSDGQDELHNAPLYTLWHYSTPMLTWADLADGPAVVALCEGHGSVSDQGGMNTAFRVLGIPLVMRRAGGSHFVEISR